MLFKECLFTNKRWVFGANPQIKANYSTCKCLKTMSYLMFNFVLGQLCLWKDVNVI